VSPVRDAARNAYAQARVQARFSLRPREAFWRELEAGRDLPHLVDFVRGSGLGDAAGTLSAALDGHALEARLRGHWAATCAEIARWYPEAWRPAMDWLAWLPWLAPLAWLAHHDDAATWMPEDPALRTLATAQPAERAELLAETPFGPLRQAWQDDGDLAAGWHAHWRSTWPATGAVARRGLERLDAAVTALLPGGDGPALDPLVDLTGQAVTRVFRRHAGTPVAGLALLVLLALDHLRLRAALALARAFGQARAA
jgi:hypothetical protein